MMHRSFLGNTLRFASLLDVQSVLPGSGGKKIGTHESYEGCANGRVALVERKKSLGRGKD